MSTILDKKSMTEEDIKLQYITPAIKSKWDVGKITMEAKVTDGRISVVDGLPVREKPKRADYLLYLSVGQPIAVVEAKDNTYSISHGLQQAMKYARMMDLPFAYSSNGDGFMEHDFLTGEEREFPLDEFPTEAELIDRYKREINQGKGMAPAEEMAMNQPYYSSQTTHIPRYYQRVAINRTIDRIARGQQRLLLVMATGTGKTYTAFQIVYRLLKSGLKRKVLYLADRNILVDQSIQQDFAPLEKITHKINFAKDDPVTITSHEVYFSLYQQLAGNDDTEEEVVEDDPTARFAALFQKDFFDLVIVDECHRGSAKKDSSWRKILDYFSSAVQIGMTATPKETKYVSNVDYFGEPVYTYSLREGIEDGFLAPFKVIHIKTDISDGWRPAKGQRDVNGVRIPDRVYTNSDYDYKITIEDRIQQVAAEITRYLKNTDRMAKTIVFCATEEAALRMRDALARLNSDMMRENPDYVVRITGSDPYGKSKLKYFISASREGPVIATTSKLLSTGADCKLVKLIVLDQMIGSMTEFKQIIGRGTRVREKDGKTHFVVMDFRDVTRLFDDPEWNGPVEQTEGYEPGDGGTRTAAPRRAAPPAIPPEKLVVDSDGCKVEIVEKMVSIYDLSGKLLRRESIADYTRENILSKYDSLDGFVRQWMAEEKKDTVRSTLLERGIDLDRMRAERNMTDVDDFDLILHVGFYKKPLTRRERADRAQKRGFLDQYSGAPREILQALLDQYVENGVYEMEKIEILRLDPFIKWGKPARIAAYFGGKAGYLEAVRELERALYTDEAGEADE